VTEAMYHAPSGRSPALEIEEVLENTPTLASGQPAARATHHHAPLAQSAEHIHGKENPGAILLVR
jgi:hypothetical protein